MLYDVRIQEILESVGEVKVFTHKHNAFNAGKTDLKDHKEYLFICKKQEEKKTSKGKAIRSPLFYVGDKYKLMPQLRELFPETIDDYIEPFVGGGSSFLNTEAKRYYLNDLDSWIIRIHKELNKYIGKEETFLSKLYELIDEYGLTCTYRGIDVPEGYRQKYIKTYFARANKEAYLKLRDDFNKNQEDILRLYLLLIYGFNHMIRFNAAGDFNLPVGNVDFNKNVYNAIHNYLSVCENKKLSFFSLDYKEFLKKVKLSKQSYVYLDPPYLISFSEYNKFWSEKEERELYSLLDDLNKRGIRFGITNLVRHKGNTNEILAEWSKKYIVYNIKSNYISFNDNTIKDDSQEVFVTNYGRE